MLLRPLPQPPAPRKAPPCPGVGSLIPGITETGMCPFLCATSGRGRPAVLGLPLPEETPAPQRPQAGSLAPSCQPPTRASLPRLALSGHLLQPSATSSQRGHCLHAPSTLPTASSCRLVLGLPWSPQENAGRLKAHRAAWGPSLPREAMNRERKCLPPLGLAQGQGRARAQPCPAQSSSRGPGGHAPWSRLAGSFGRCPAAGRARPAAQGLRRCGRRPPGRGTGSPQCGVVWAAAPAVRLLASAPPRLLRA